MEDCSRPAARRALVRIDFLPPKRQYIDGHTVPSSRPSIPASVRQQIFGVLLRLLEPVASWRAYEADQKKRLKSSKTTVPPSEDHIITPAQPTARSRRKRQKTARTTQAAPEVPGRDPVQKPSAPDVHPFLAVGINNVTRILELQIARDRRELLGIDPVPLDLDLDRSDHGRSSLGRDPKRTRTSSQHNVLEPRTPNATHKSGDSDKAEQEGESLVDDPTKAEAHRVAVKSAAKKAKKQLPVKLVFVSRGDVQSHNIVNHLPTLVGIANATARSLANARATKGPNELIATQGQETDSEITKPASSSNLKDSDAAAVNLTPNAVDVDQEQIILDEQIGETTANGGERDEDEIVSDDPPLTLGHTLLIGLDQGAEALISEKLGVARCAALALPVRLSLSLSLS
jgi:hypothetical protein